MLLSRSLIFVKHEKIFVSVWKFSGNVLLNFRKRNCVKSFTTLTSSWLKVTSRYESLFLIVFNFSDNTFKISMIAPSFF